MKEIVLRRWKLEYDESLQYNNRIKKELEAIRYKMSRIIDLYIDGKLNDDDKESKLQEADIGLALMTLQMMGSNKDITDNELIIDGALLFMSDPAMFWNQGDVTLKNKIQDSVFPESLTYDFENGFGTAKLADSCLLINKKVESSTENSSVGVNGSDEWT